MCCVQQTEGNKIVLAWCEILKAKTRWQRGKQRAWGSKVASGPTPSGSSSSSDCRQKVTVKRIRICYISSESECLPSNKWFQVLPTMSSEMPLLIAAVRFNASAPSFPFEMCESVPVIEAVRCRITTVNGKGKHKCSQQGLISCCVTMKNCSAFKQQNCAGSKVLTTTSYVPKCVFEMHFPMLLKKD